MSPTDFFYQHIGSKIGVAAGEGIKSVRIPQRAKESVKELNLGQMDCFYIAADNGPSYLIGRVELEPKDTLQFIGTETTSARKYIAQWLLQEAVAPFIVGVIGKAHPESSFHITHHLAMTQFCDTTGNFHVNVEQARLADQRIAHLVWKKVVAPAIHAYADYIQAPQDNNQKEKDKLLKLIAKTSELSQLLPTLGLRPGSGEYTLLSWKNIEQKQ